MAAFSFLGETGTVNLPVSRLVASGFPLRRVGRTLRAGLTVAKLGVTIMGG